MNPSIDYFSSDALRQDLKGRTVRGGLWMGAGQAIVLVVQLAAIPILARLLDPTDFGLTAMVTVFTGIAAMLVDAGLSTATVQRDEITSQQVSNLFWLATLLGVAVAIVHLLLAPGIAWFYGEPRLIPITIALALAPIFSGLTIQHEALLLRTMMFRQLAVRRIASTFVSYVIAVLIAWQTESYWALVSLPILMALTRMIVAWLCCKWRPSLPRRDAGVREMVYFGANLSAANFVNYLAASLDRMAIGRFFGAQATGYYDQAWRMLLYPIRQANGPLTSVMTPVLSRSLQHPEVYRRIYLDVINSVLVVVTPIFAVVVACPNWVVLFVFGPGWETTAAIIRTLALGSVALVISNSTGWLFISQNRVVGMRRWQMADALMRPVVIAAGLPWGVVGVAGAYTIRTVLICAVLYWYLGRSGPIRSRELIHQLAWSVCVLGLTATAIMLVAPQLAQLALFERISLVGIFAILTSTILWTCNTETRRVLGRLPVIVQNHVLRRSR